MPKPSIPYCVPLIQYNSTLNPHNRISNPYNKYLEHQQSIHTSTRSSAYSSTSTSSSAHASLSLTPTQTTFPGLALAPTLENGLHEMIAVLQTQGPQGRRPDKKVSPPIF